jgi:hypothetical protein
MSVIIDATYEGETFEVEVFHDGHLEFPDRDLRHEQAMEEFTNSESAVIQFNNAWGDDRIGTYLEYLWAVKENRVLMAADYAEHVLHIYETRYPNDWRPASAISAARKHVKRKIDSSKLRHVERQAREATTQATAVVTAALAEADKAADDIPFILAARAAVDAASSAAWAAMAMNVANAKLRVKRTANDAAQAAAWNVSDDGNTPEWSRAHKAERAWQVRRFVDVFEALGQGLPWPPLEATP